MNKINLPNNYENIDENEIRKIEGGADGNEVTTISLSEPIFTSTQNNASNIGSSILSSLFSKYISPMIQPVISSITTSLGNRLTSSIQTFFTNLFNR